MVAAAREEVLKFFNSPTGEYKCVFTSGATAALKLVGESFPWTSRSNFWYTMENHNSVLGIREYALAIGASAHAVDIEDSDQLGSFRLRACQRRTTCVPEFDQEEGLVYNLFAFPSECNFSGRKFNLDLINCIQDGRHTKEAVGRWMVLIDAAKGCGTSSLDLSKYPADFVAISFYKIFGYPTGLGALLVRTDSARKLHKKYFGGGTVAASVADVDFVQKRQNIEQWLEDGTVPFLGIASLQGGFRNVKKLGIYNIGMHVGCLAKFTASQLSGLRHKNGNIACVLYGDHDSESYWGDNCSQGPIVTFNLKRLDGSWIGYREVEKLASLSYIHLRTGCFCNPGACSKYLGLLESEIRANHEGGHVCWDDHDIIDGKPTGAVRVSFGYMSTIEDSLGLLDFVCKYFVDNSASCLCSSLNQQGGLLSNATTHKGDHRMHLESITIYPIKSCGGFSVDSWPLGDCGLLYDREWVVMSSSGDALTQKKCPMMCLIGTYIEPSVSKLFVTSPNMRTRLEVSLKEISHQAVDVGFDLCGERSKGKLSEEEVADWFTQALGTACTLVRKEPSSRQVRLSGGPCDLQTCKEARELSFANEGQFLLISRASVDDLNHRASSSIQSTTKKRAALHAQKMQVDVMRFRPNFVISGGLAFEEDSWQSLYLGDEKFIVLGGCNRCQMINIDQTTGRPQEGSNPLLTLASYRRFKGKILFGLLLAHIPSQQKRLEHMGRHNGSGQPERVVKIGCHVYSDSSAYL